MLYQGKVGDDQAENLSTESIREHLFYCGHRYLLHWRHGIREKVRFKVGILDRVEEPDLRPHLRNVIS